MALPVAYFGVRFFESPHLNPIWAAAMAALLFVLVRFIFYARGKSRQKRNQTG
jgi:hypothetical protein